MSRESFDSLHSLTTLQPGIITNDRLGEDYPGDYKTFERNIPEQAPAVPDWEVCMPISGSWGFKRSDTEFKSPTALIRNLVGIASKGGNYLLNVSPTTGTFFTRAAPISTPTTRTSTATTRLNSGSSTNPSPSPLSALVPAASKARPSPAETRRIAWKTEYRQFSEANRNLFGLCKKTGRLPGHTYYYKKSIRSDLMSKPIAFFLVSLLALCRFAGAMELYWKRQ